MQRLNAFLYFLSSAMSIRARRERTLRFDRLEDRRVLATLTVNVAADSALSVDGEGIDDGDLTLREAFAIVNGTYEPVGALGDVSQIDETIDPLGVADRIVFDSTVFPVDGQMQTIDLAHGELVIDTRVDLQLIGPGSDELTLDASMSDQDTGTTGNGTRHILYDPPALVHSMVIEGIAFVNGDAVGAGGAIQAENGSLYLRDTLFDGNTSTAGGGAVYSEEAIHVVDSTFRQNRVTNGNGGAIEAQDQLSLSRSVVSGNTASGDGGGVYVEDRRSSYDDNNALIHESTIDGNTSTNGSGGGVWIEAYAAQVVGSSIYNNDSAGNGGGLFVYSETAYIAESTISGNESGGLGGGIFTNVGSVGLRTPHILEHLTITDNTANNGGAVYASELTVLLAVLASGNYGSNGITANNLSGTYDPRSSYNLIGPSTAVGFTLSESGNIDDADNNPDLGGLANNGGPTLSHLPSQGSDAINGGGRAWVFDQYQHDQRGPGFSRGYDGYYDIGAIETGHQVVTPASVQSLSHVVSNVGLNDFTFMSRGLTGFGTQIRSIDDWVLAGDATADYYNHYIFPNIENSSAEHMPLPPDGSYGYVGMLDEDFSTWHEYITATPDRTLLTGETFKVNLYAGISTGRPDQTPETFEGNLVVYGITDASVLPWDGEGDLQNELSSNDYYELLSLPVDLNSRGEWTGWPTQEITIQAPVEAIVIGPETSVPGNYYLLMDMSIPRDKILGDFTEDGVVDASDYTLWRDTYDETVHPHFGADHSGNGRVDTQDYLIWVENYGATLQFMGDYNDDGVVNAADYTVWRDSFGDSVTPGTGADGNGDGEVNQADYAIWHNNYGASYTTAPDPAAIGLLVAYVSGDFTGDGNVDYDDYLHWEATLGDVVPVATGADANANGVIDLNDLAVWQEFNGISTLPDLLGDFNGDGVVDDQDLTLWDAGDPLADGNQDGVVDSLDLDIWTAHYGMVHASVWPTLANAVGGSAPNLAGAPQVAGFTVGQQGGGVHDLGALAGSGEQLRSVPLASVDQVSITFSEQVLVLASDLLLVNLDGSGSGPSVTDLNYDLATNTATWTFDSALSDGRQLVRLKEGIFDLDGDEVDGEFTNPWMLSETGASVLPSGDGLAGGQFRFRFTVLAGDSDRDNVDGATDYRNWQSTEPGMVYVSTTADELDSDFSFGDMSLREAVQHANAAAEPTTIVLPAGRYGLSLMGNEIDDGSHNDLDINSDVKILGQGAGVSIIDTAAFAPMSNQLYNRAFHVEGSGSRLEIAGVTLTGGDSGAALQGTAVLVKDEGELILTDSAVVDNTGSGDGVAIRSQGGDVTIRRSVFTNNVSTQQDATALFASTFGGHSGSVTIGESIFALNEALAGTVTPNVWVTNTVTKVNEGKNLYDNASGNFFNQVAGPGDYLGTPDYVVTTIADTFDHADDIESLSIRDAIDLANQNAGQEEVWLPAWNFQLTRDRQTYGSGSTTDTDISYGDLDITDSLIVRGIEGFTSVAWKAGIVDEVFDLAGDAATWQQSEGTVDSTDLWAIDLHRNNGLFDETIDVDDDGDIDQDDYDLAFANQGNTLALFDVG